VTLSDLLFGAGPLKQAAAQGSPAQQPAQGNGNAGIDVAALAQQQAARSLPLFSAPGPTDGMASPGTIDLKKLPVIYNPDGSYSTVNSTSFSDEKKGSPTYGKEVLVPGILNGKKVDPSNPATLAAMKAQYYKTGQHLGTFNDPDSADAYATRLHNDWQAGKIPGVQMPNPALMAPRPAGTSVGLSSLMNGGN
jgi:hypothetical protein